MLWVKSCHPHTIPDINTFVFLQARVSFKFGICIFSFVFIIVFILVAVTVVVATS